MNPSSSIDLEHLQTPKLVKSQGLATSTVVKDKKKPHFVDTNDQDSTLGILSLSNVNLSNIANQSKIDEVLKEQRQLANNTLNRAMQVSLVRTGFLTNNLEESTISESDVLLQTPKTNPQNTSTPRSSTNKGRESIFSKFKDILDTDISTQNAFEEFKQISQANNASFVPAEEAASKLLADEMSYNKKQIIPITESLHETNNLPSISMGEFFLQGSDLSELCTASPPKVDEPEPLIDSTVFSTTNNQAYKSLSITAIQQIIAQDSPNKAFDFIFNQNQKKSSLATGTRESSDVFSLPVSQDTSYTSSFSDNEAIKVAVAQENKENMQPKKTGLQTGIPKSSSPTFLRSLPIQKPLSSYSLRPSFIPEPTATGPSRPSSTSKPLSPGPSRSSSSLTSLPNGKLPIESTVGELVWGCVKTNKCVAKKFMIRNRSEKTLRIQCAVSTQEFKIRKDNHSDSDHLTACKLVLYGHESRPLVISYIPNRMGPAIDELCFIPLDAHLTQTQKQCVRLWGYGGYVNIEYLNTSRDNTGKYWLSLGKMDNRLLMEQTFTIKNTGNLASFTYIKVVPKNLITFCDVKVEPNRFILAPNQEKTIKVIYGPKAKDCNFLRQNIDLFVLDIGKLEIVSGAEVNRTRLRRLYRKSQEKGLDVNKLARILTEKIPGEITSSEAQKFKEAPSAINEILETFKNGEIILTIEQDPDQTLVAEYPEDSIIYQTIGELQDDTMLQPTILTQQSCHVEPASLVLLPPSKTEDRLFLISNSTNVLHYEVNSNPKGLHITPTDGTIIPGQAAEFKIKLLKGINEKSFKVYFYVENEVFEATVKVLVVGGGYSRNKSHFLK